MLRDVSGRAAGYLELVDSDEDDRVDRAKIDGRVLRETGSPGWLSLAWSGGAGIPFDDVAVSAALRACLRRGSVDFLSTLTRSDDTIVGAVSGVTGLTAEQAAVALRDDPFAGLFPCRLVSYGPGLFGTGDLPAGPSIQRYGSSAPWPHDRF